MLDMELTKTRFQAGVWEGVLKVSGTANTPPRVVATHLEQEIAGVALNEVPDQVGLWSVQIPVPVECLSDGMQTFLITDQVSGGKLGSFSVLSGEPLSDDLRAEIDLLRAELDMLKRAFRRHCVETL
ncbi:MAG: hypothetical protein ABJO67_05810 [Pseudoruegeria sp.]